MSAIKATWNGHGLADGTTLSAAVVNAAGNSFGTGVVWAWANTGTPEGVWTAVTEGDGFRYTAAATAQVQLRGNVPAGTKSVRVQAIFTMPGTATGNLGVIQAYNEAGVNAGWVRLVDGTMFEVYRNAGIPGARTPAMATGSKALVDVVYTAGASSTRIFYRVTNLSDPAWNGTGHFFFDTGYTLPGVASYSTILFGKTTAGTALEAPGVLAERLGVEAITVPESATSEAAATAYFADEPGDPLATPVVTVTGSVNPSAPGVEDGSITATWANVPGASRYEAGVAFGDVDDGFVVTSTTATSPYTWTGLGGGVHTVAIRAIP